MPRLIHVLHLEDNPADVRLFQEYLKEAPGSFDVQVAGRLSDCIDRLSRETFDVVLMDLGLPDSRGIETFQKTSAKFPGMPIIVLSGLRDEELAMRAVHEGAQDYLIKRDISARALARSIDYAIERKQTGQRVLHLNRILRSIREINRLIVREKDKDTLLKKACEIICEVSSYRFVWIGLVEPGHTRVIPTAHAGFEEGYLTAVTMTWDNEPTGRGPTGTAIRKRKTVVREDLILDSECGPWAKEYTARGYRASLAAPLFHDKTVYGALNVYSDKPGFFDKEEVLLLSEIARDIALALFMIESEQKRIMAEQEAVYLKKYNESIINAMPDPIDIVDRAMTIVFQNRASREKFGNGIDKKCHDFYHGSGQPCGHCTAVNALKEKKTYSRDVLIKNGLYAEVISSPILLPDGRLCCMEIIRDITDRKRAEEELSRSNEALRETEKRQKAILDNIPDIAWLKDKESRFIAVNEPFARMFGFAPEDLAGKTDHDICPADLARSYRKDDRDVMNSGVAKTVEEPLTDVEGKTHWIETIKTPILGNHGEVIGTTGIARDITERRQIEEQLREQADILDQIHDIVVTTDLRGTITSWSRGAERQMGYRADEMLGRPISLIYPESDYEATKKRMIDGLRGNGEIRDEFTIKRKDGTEFPAHLTLILRKDTGGKTVGTIGSAVDITERKKAEEALRESELRYRLVAENANDIIFTIGTDLKFTYVSPSVMRLRGFTAKETMAQTADEALTPESFRLVINSLKKRLAAEAAVSMKVEGTSVLQLEMTCADGSTVWTETMFSTLRDEYSILTGFLGITRDITERRMAEQALRESETKYRELMENSIDVVFLMDSSGVFTDVNDAFLKEGGYRREDIVGRGFSLMLHPNDTAIAADSFQKGLRGELSKFEMRAIKKDGSFNWYSFINRPILDSTGKTVAVHGIARNINERKLVEAALHEREEQLSAVTDNLTGTVSRVDRDLRYLYANKTYERWHGRPPEAVLGLTMPEVIGDEAFKLAKPYIERALAGERVSFEGPVKNPSGDLLHGLVTYVPDVDADGTVKGLFIVVNDITERKKAEEALKASEEKYRLVVENGNEAIVVAQDDILKFVNPQTEVLSGYSREELLGKPFTEFIYSEDRGGVLKHYQKRLTGETAIYPERFRITHRNGEPRWAETRVVIIDWEGRPATLVFFHDITEQRLAEEARRESEKKYRDLFERSKDTIFMATVDGRIVAINPAGSELFGYTEEEIKDINVAEFYVNPDDRARFRQQIEEQGYTKDFEITYRKKDGTFLDCLETATVARDRKGRIVGYQGTIRDVTEHKKMEKRLVQAEKLSSLGGMISGVAHELNNPLTSIIGNAQLLMRKEIPHDFRNKLEVIQRESVRCTRIVGGLLSFAREHRPQRRMIDINTVLMESLKLREYDLKVNNIQIGTNLADDLPETSADPFQFQQVFINLINNSHDALREKGGGTLSIRSFSKDNSIYVVFADDGPGIEPGVLNRIFDPFFTTKDVGKGTGLGLSIAYGIVNEHGGTIEVESRPENGSAFTVRVPIVKQDELIVMDKKVSLSDRQTKKRQILIVEDEEPLRNFIAEALTEEGYGIKSASCGEEAIELLKILRFDCIISDLKMPGIGGKELYTFIHKHTPDLSERVLFMTGDVLGNDTQHFLEITGNPYIEKPFELPQLFSIIQTLFDTDK